MASDIDLRALRFLIVAGEEGSLGKAARRLHLSQPGLSVQIRHLEEHLGTALLVRGHGGVTLTPSGEVAVREGKRLLHAADAFRGHVRAQDATKRPVLRLEFTANGAAELMPVLLRAFERRRPDVDLVLHEVDLFDQLAGLRNGRSDATLVRLPIDGTEDFAMLELFAEPRLVVLPHDHRLAHRSSVTVEELLGEPWVAGSSGASRDFWTLRSHRRVPAPVVSEARTVAELWSAVSSGRAICACPASAARYENRPELAFVPIEDIEPSVCALAWHPDDARPELRALLDTAEAARRALPRELAATLG